MRSASAAKSVCMPSTLHPPRVGLRRRPAQAPDLRPPRTCLAGACGPCRAQRHAPDLQCASATPPRPR
eukprot:4032496-Prymnesium_polylepis.2